MDIISEALRTASDSLMTDRDFGSYSHNLDFSIKDFERWKTVVDLGSGLGQGLAKACKRMGIKSRIISIDPRIIMPEEIDLYRDLEEKEIEERKKVRKNPHQDTIAALGQNFPLKGNSVDVILASHSIPMYIYDQTNMDSVFREIGRVLKKGGEARMFPAFDGNQTIMVENAIAKNPKLEVVQRVRVDDNNQGYLLIVKKTS